MVDRAGHQVVVFQVGQEIPNKEKKFQKYYINVFSQIENEKQTNLINNLISYKYF